MHKLIDFDQQLFHKINYDWTNPFFDAVLPYVRTPLYWTPVYVFLIAFVLLNFRVKGVWWVVLFLTTIALTDMTGTYLFKHNFERLRPCSDPSLPFQVRLLLKTCAAGYSFVSNHAANHFGMAAFFFFTFRSNFKKWAWIALLLAFLVAFSQVYVGVHYPLDVICGGLLGLLFGAFTGTLFNKRFGFAIFDDQPTK